MTTQAKYNKLMRCAKIAHEMSCDESLPTEIRFNISRAETLLKIAVTDI